MARRFEDLMAWKKARILTREICHTTRRTGFASDYGLARQIQRAAVSIMSNIAEGFERGTRKEFCQFLTIAKGSCAEVRSQLYVALDADYIDEERFHSLYSSTEEVARIIGGLRASLLRPRTE